MRNARTYEERLNAKKTIDKYKDESISLTEGDTLLDIGIIFNIFNMADMLPKPDDIDWFLQWMLIEGYLELKEPGFLIPAEKYSGLIKGYINEYEDHNDIERYYGEDYLNSLSDVEYFSLMNDHGIYINSKLAREIIDKVYLYYVSH